MLPAALRQRRQERRRQRGQLLLFCRARARRSSLILVRASFLIAPQACGRGVWARSLLGVEPGRLLVLVTLTRYMGKQVKTVLLRPLRPMSNARAQLA